MDNRTMVKVSMHDFAIVDNDIYFFALNHNGLYKMEWTTKRIAFMGSVPGEIMKKRHLYGAIVGSGSKLFLPPMDGEEIAIYDMKKDNFEKIPLKYPASGMKSKFFGALLHDGNVYFIPCRYHYLVVLNIKSGKVSYYGDWYNILDLPVDYNGMLVKNGYCITQNKLYMALMEKNLLIKISLTDYKTEIIEIGTGSTGFVDMCIDEDGKHIWLVRKNVPEIIKWNEKSNECIIYDNIPKGFQCKEYPFINIISEKNKIYVIAYQANMSLEIDKDSNEISMAKWEQMENVIPNNAWNAQYYFAKKILDCSYLVADVSSNQFSILKDNEIQSNFFLTDYLFEFEFRQKNNGLLEECSKYTLEKFNQYILKKYID